MARPTIVDIARAAGVSKGAVSFALNGRPGVSDKTRARVQQVAAEMGWLPNVAARSLAGTRAGAIGLVFARSADTLSAEPFFMRLIAGIESELSLRSVALVFQVVTDHTAEIATYRRWAAERRVDGLLVVDPFVDDDRIGPLDELAMPSVFVGVPPSDDLVAGVWSDDATSMSQVLKHLVGLGHKRVVRVAGSNNHQHVQVRNETFRRISAELGLDEAMIVETDYTAEQGAQATRAILMSPRPPSAIIYDNDVMAVAGLGVTQQLRIDVPGELSLVAWDDSQMCRICHPTMTALGRDIENFGATAASLLLDMLDGQPPRKIETPAGVLIARGSTGPVDAQMHTTPR
ncbi:transcriptional regulator, LacI family [Sanguibacter gelidistatuariae]|uniref:Transcriptional regulator, LacI family n=1 Tax=Sanguibacter gelidistatuariae TaxID=1814289 RepID=A0A1G6GVN3_9MICO|nr:LacI family DNA-binding transcriptional regulator [Sanguibacter gelidistatuariae]SDB85923.1 transcriptional regulator, LacI family [Sanguibacter gelidistatuariae]